MIENILTVDQSKNIEQGRLMNFNPNDIMISIDDGATADISTIDDLDAVIVNARLKRGNTKLLLSSMRVSDILKITNALGGYAFKASDGYFVGRLPIGNIDLSGQEVLEVEVQNSASFTDLEISISALDTMAGPEDIRTYEGITSGGDNQSFKDCLSIFNVDDYTGSATVSDGSNSNQITAQEADDVAQSTFEMETVMPEIGLVYSDKYRTGRNLTAKLPTGNYVVVGRL